MPIKQDRVPNRWPPDRLLASTGFVKELYDRIRSKKDRVSKRMANGKPIFDFRLPTQLSGLVAKIDDEVRRISDTAIGHYESKDCEVFIVLVDEGMACAEAIKDGSHLWSHSAESAEQLIRTIYNLFPAGKETRVTPKNNVDEMTPEELENALKRKKVQKVAKSPDLNLPSAKISAEEIKAAQDPEVIAREKAQEEQKEIPAE